MSNTKTNEITEPVDLREINALLKYAAERGINPDPLKALYTDAQAAAPQAGDGDAPSRSAFVALAPERRAKLLEEYAVLVKLTLPVTGRTLIHTSDRFERATRPLKIWTLIFLFLAVGNEVLKAWLGDIPEPEEGWLLDLVNLRRYALEYFVPFFWGALGSLAYLLKRLSDIAEEQTFDQSLSRGWAIRVFLGAMLGGIVQFIYDPSVLTEGMGGFKPTAIALGFLTGVGVKVVYGAIEKTIDVLASKLNLDAIRTTKAETSAVKVYLNDQLAKTSKEKEPEKHKAILALIGDLQVKK